MKSRKAVTLVEVVVAFFILAMASGSLYYVLSAARYRSALASARDAAKNEVTRATRLIQSDFQQARLQSFEQVNQYVTRIKVRKESDPDKDARLEYRYVEPFLRRIVGNREWLVSENITKFNVQPVADSAGQIVVEIEASFAFDGIREDDTQKFSNSQLVTMREDANFANDPHWRDVGSVSSFFQTQGNLLAGLKENAGQLFEDIAAGFSNTFEDIENMSAAQLQHAQNEMRQAFSELELQIAGINGQIQDLDREAVFDFGSGFSRLVRRRRQRRMRRYARNVKSELAGIQSIDDMDWDKVMAHVPRYQDRMRDAPKQLFNGKMDMFLAAEEIVDTMESIGMDTSEFDLSRLGSTGIADAVDDVVNDVVERVGEEFQQAQQRLDNLADRFESAYESGTMTAEQELEMNRDMFYNLGILLEDTSAPDHDELLEDYNELKSRLPADQVSEIEDMISNR